MLLFIGVQYILMLRYIRISIHLMLLFIIINCFLFVQYFHFNTSHVTVYLYSSILFLFTLNSFQYISCYCLSRFYRLFRQITDISIHLMLLFISRRPGRSSRKGTFQYISCYCLSIWELK